MKCSTYKISNKSIIETLAELEIQTLRNQSSNKYIDMLVSTTKATPREL